MATGGIAASFAAWEAGSSYVAYTDDAYVRSDLVGVAPEVTGRVIAVHALDNQAVQAGDPLITIDPVPFQLVVAQHRASVDEARAQIRADTDALAAARDADDSAAAAQRLAEETQRRAEALDRSGDAPRARLDQANEVLQAARAAGAGARAKMSRDEALRAAHEAGLARAEAELATAEWNLGRTRMTAPASGTIVNLTVRVGDTAQVNVPLIGIIDAAAFRIVANFKQNSLRNIHDGATAWVWLDSQPWHLHRATIQGIARGISRGPMADRLLPYVAPTTDWIRLQHRFPVTMTLEGPPPGDVLFMGADARVAIFP